MVVYAARHILPVSAPPIRDGAVAVHDGRIARVGPRAGVLAEVPDATVVRDLGDSVVIPGLVNAHTHVELSWMGPNPPVGDSYEAWLRGLLELRDREEESAAVEAARVQADRLVERGTVAVGDVANRAWIAPILARAGLHGVVFLELLGLDAAKAEHLLRESAERLERVEQDADVGAARERLRVVLTPHAPHTVAPGLLRALAGRAAAAREPLMIHVAESEGEIRLLQDASGPLAELFRERGFWHDGWQPPGRTPVEYLDRLGVLTERTVAVHCVHLSRQDHSKLQARGVTVVTCPRSNARLGVGTAPIHRLLGEGIPVAIGTDSLASAPDLDLFAEMAALRSEDPSLRPAAILRMATLNGARALGVDRLVGSIEAGKTAELVVLPLESPDADPLSAVVGQPTRVYRLEQAPAEGS